MKGLELSERYYREYGKPMIEEQFADVKHLLAVGLVGSGSECMGYDDAISRDHDFEPGFCIFLPDEDVLDRKRAFALERAYDKLPKEFLGYQRQRMSPVGGNRHGVIRISDFYREKTGHVDCAFSLRDWFSIPEQSLAEATNGKVFEDNYGAFSAIRDSLAYFPEDVRLKKMAGHLLLMGQAGQYNYSRCVARGEYAAAQLAVVEFAKSALALVFLLNKRYLPYYKWSFAALRELQTLASVETPLSFLLMSDNEPSRVCEKKQKIEEICEQILSALKEQKLTSFGGSEAEGHAYSVNDRIEDNFLRNTSIFYGV